MGDPGSRRSRMVCSKERQQPSPNGLFRTASDNRGCAFFSGLHGDSCLRAWAIPILIAPALCGNEDGAYAAVGLIAVALVLATLFEWLHRSSAPRTSGDGVGILALGLAVVFAAGIYAMVNRYQFVTESQGERTRVRTLDRWTGKEVEVSSWRASGPPAPSVKWK